MTAAKFDRITVDPKEMNGQPCIRGTHLTVRRVVEGVSLHPNREELFREYPELGEDDVRQALEFAAANLDEAVNGRMLRPAVSTVAAEEVSGARELAWLRSHWQEYVDRWVVLDGDRLVAESASAREAAEEARALGFSAPFIVHVTEPSDLPFGGW
jgi:uncharacterized protein (DUF433 family)